VNEVQNPSRDESLLDLPQALRTSLYPRRGFRPCAAPEPELEAVAWLQDLVAANEDDLRQTLASPLNSVFAADALDYLDGNANPVGAGIVATGLWRRPIDRRSPHLALELDAWRQRHGLPFAVCAWMVAQTVWLWGNDKMEPSKRQFRGESPALFIERPLVDEQVRPIFAMLAAAEDNEYNAVRTAIGTLRNTPARRFLSAYFLPEEAHWVKETCEENNANPWGSGLNTQLLNSIATPAEFAALGITEITSYDIYKGLLAPLVNCLGADALPLLTKWLRDDPRSDYRGHVLDMIALLPSDKAMAYLFDHYGEPLVPERVAKACARFPRRGLRTIASIAPTAWPERRVALAALVDSADARAWDVLSPGDRASLATLQEQTLRKPATPSQKLPSLLTAPPWETPSIERQPIIVKGLTAPPKKSLEWTESEREQFKAGAAAHDPNSRWSYRWDRKAERIQQGGASRGDAEFFAYAPQDLAAPLLDLWDGKIEDHNDDRVASQLQALLVRFELDVLDRLVAFIGSTPKCSRYLAPVLSLDAARLAAHWLVRVKAAKEDAAAWLDRHGTDAAALLIPDALSGKKKQRITAEAALHHLAARSGPQPLLHAAAAYGDAATNAIGALLETGPELPPQQIPKAGAWLDPNLLPQVLMKDGSTGLPETSVPHMASILGAALDPNSRAWLTEVTDVCDRDSLRIFSWALFEQWLSRGAPWSDHWVLSALAHFGDDETVDRLVPLIKAWPGQNQHHRAVAGLKVLGAIGTEEALRAMQHVSQRAKFKAIKSEAASQIQVIADRLGLTREQLADRLVPDFGLESDGSMMLDYGPRRFTINFDEQLKPLVIDDSGKLRKAPPKPGASDDPVLAAAAYQQFATFRKELRPFATDQVHRLEAAMISGRTWNSEEFTRCFLQHPLMRQLAKRMIWSAETVDTQFEFRIAEDGSLSTVNEEPIELPKDGAVRLPHPVDMGLDSVVAWGQILADYEILQPFEQLSRPVMALTEPELASGVLERFQGVYADPGRILGLTAHGWVRGEPMDAGSEHGIHYPLPGGGFVAVELTPGIQIGMGTHNDEQHLESVYLTNELDPYYRRRGATPTAIDPRAASEALSSLESLIKET
jgi:hypothetical protein